MASFTGGHAVLELPRNHNFAFLWNSSSDESSCEVKDSQEKKFSQQHLLLLVLSLLDLRPSIKSVFQSVFLTLSYMKHLSVFKVWLVFGSSLWCTGCVLYRSPVCLEEKYICLYNVHSSQRFFFHYWQSSLARTAAICSRASVSLLKGADITFITHLFLPGGLILPIVLTAHQAFTH